MCAAVCPGKILLLISFRRFRRKPIPTNIFLQASRCKRPSSQESDPSLTNLQLMQQDKRGWGGAGVGSGGDGGG